MSSEAYTIIVSISVGSSNYELQISRKGTMFVLEVCRLLLALVLLKITMSHWVNTKQASTHSTAYFLGCRFILWRGSITLPKLQLLGQVTEEAQNLSRWAS